MAQIGGFIQLPERTIWFSERFSPEDFYQLEVEVNHNMQRDIVCYETLAQLAIVKLMTLNIPAQRYALRISSLSDNTGAEAGVNSLFTTKTPLAFFLEKLCITATTTGIHLDVSHISGKSNELADAISRWNLDGDPPAGVKIRTVVGSHCVNCGSATLVFRSILVTLPCPGTSPNDSFSTCWMNTLVLGVILLNGVFIQVLLMFISYGCYGGLKVHLR